MIKMDEILDRLKNNFQRFKKTSFKKRSLAITLILAEIIGILTLLWYLREPLSKKYLTYTPKAYSIIVMNNKASYVLRNGDFIVGNTIPNTKVTTLITPNKIKNSATAGKDGSWNYVIPDDIKTGRYKFTVGYFDKSNKLTFYKTYSIRIISNNIIQGWLNKITGWFPFSLKKAQAQTFGPERTSFIAANSYNLTIIDIGSQSNIINPGDNIYPQALVYDYSGNRITEDSNFTINYFLQNDFGEITNLITFDDCSGINVCSWKIPDDITPGYYYLTANLNISDQDPVPGANSILINIGQNIPLQNIASEASTVNESDTPFQFYSTGTGGCIARGKLFLEATGGEGGELVPIPGYFIDPTTNLTTDQYFNLRKWVGQNEDFCILGKFVSANNPETKQYKVIFDNEGSNFQYKGYFAIPIAKVSITSGDLLIPNTPFQKNYQLGARVNKPENNNYANLYNNLDQLGVGVVRILIDEARPEEMDSQYQLIDEAIDRGYFLILQYQPIQRSHRKRDRLQYAEDPSPLSNFDYDVVTTYGRLKTLFDYLKNRGVTTDRFAIELGNEPNIRWSNPDRGKYFSDCARFETETGTDELDRYLGESNGPIFERDQSGNVIVSDLDITSDKCNLGISHYHVVNIYYAFADFINSSSTAIWTIDPEIKIIVGAIYIQLGGDSGNIFKFNNEQYNWFLGALEAAMGEDKFKKLDFAIHAYQIWSSETDKSDIELWKRENDGLEAAYYALINNQIFRKYHDPDQGCNCIWATEFGIDILKEGQRIYEVFDIFKAVKQEEQNIKSIIIHEFNGGNDPGHEPGIFQLYSDSENLKYPLFNMLQYLNLLDYVQTAP